MTCYHQIQHNCHNLYTLNLLNIVKNFTKNDSGFAYKYIVIVVGNIFILLLIFYTYQKQEFDSTEFLISICVLFTYLQCFNTQILFHFSS